MQICKYWFNLITLTSTVLVLVDPLGRVRWIGHNQLALFDCFGQVEMHLANVRLHVPQFTGRVLTARPETVKGQVAMICRLACRLFPTKLSRLWILVVAIANFDFASRRLVNGGSWSHRWSACKAARQISASCIVEDGMQFRVLSQLCRYCPLIGRINVQADEHTSATIWHFVHQLNVLVNLLARGVHLMLALFPIAAKLALFVSTSKVNEKKRLD